MLLQGKTAIVYGAAGGVGNPVAKAFAGEGATVFLAGRTGAAAWSTERLASAVFSGKKAPRLWRHRRDPVQLHDFRVLSFDCFGTLIDWESGIVAALKPLVEIADPGLPRNEILETFARHEAAQEAETPTMIYSDLLAAVHGRIAKEWDVPTSPADNARFGASVGDWPAFPDSPAALHYLKQHYKLVILSNVDRASFARSHKRLSVTFDYIFTAQDVGAYKPSPKNFEYLIGHLAEAGFAKSDILHTAESLFHDHAPANAFGLASAWIYRRHGQEGFGATSQPKEMPHIDFRFNSMAEMADAHRKEAA